MTKRLTPSELDKFLSSPPSGSVVREMPPKLAEFILKEKNPRNRPINPTKVVGLSKELSQNKWLLNGETLKFSDERFLIDGQHRLEACVRSNTAFIAHIIFGIDKDSFQTIDIGKKRDGSDTLAMMGVPNYRSASTIIRMIIAYENGLTRTPKHGISNDWIKRKYQDEIDHDLLQESVAVADRLYKTTKWPRGVIGAFFYTCVKKKQREEITKFLDDMCKGIGNKARAPVRFLLENVNRMRIDRDFNLRAHQYSVMLSRAYRNYKNGKASTKADVTVSLVDKMVGF